MWMRVLPELSCKPNAIKLAWIAEVQPIMHNEFSCLVICYATPNGAPLPNVFSKMTKWPSDLYPRNMWISSFSMPYAIKKGHFLSDLSFIKKWPFIKKQKTLALLINILNIAPILFSTSLCRKFRYKKHTHFSGFDIPISFRTHSDIIPKARNHQKLTIIWGQKRTTFSEGTEKPLKFFYV